MKKKTNDAKDPSKMSPQEIATELANNKKRRIELAKKLVRSDKEKAELQELGDRWRELYNYQKSTHIPGWYGTFPGASLDSAEKTWAITQDMMNGKFTSDAEEPWVVFTLNGKELAAYTVRGTFSGELQATKELLAAEKGVDVSQIKHRIETRKTGKSTKDAEGSEVKNSTGVVKCKKCGSQLWNLRSGEYYCAKCGAKMDAPLSKDAEQTMSWKTMFMTLAEKMKNYCNHELGIKCNVSKSGQYYVLTVSGTPEDLKKVKSFIMRNTIHEKTSVPRYEAADDAECEDAWTIAQQKELEEAIQAEKRDKANELQKKKVSEISSNMTGDSLETEASFRAEYMSILKKANALQKQAQMAYKSDDLAKGDALWKAFYKEADRLGALVIAGNKKGYTEPKERINYYPKPVGDSKMAGANYRMSLDEAAKARMTKDETHTWLTMFVSLAEKVKNYCNVNLGIKCDVSKPGSYYKLIITGTPEELRKVESFINRNTIHEQN